MLSAAELAAMRDIEELVMPSTGVIERYGLTSDGIGGFTEAWAAVGTVSCDLWPVNQREERERFRSGGQIISKSDWFVTVPFDTNITAADRIVVDGRSFEIVFVPSDRSWSTALRCEAVAHNEERRV